MSLHILQNDSLIIKIDDYGAELTSILHQKTNTEYLWDASPEYWKRHSPILFPFVGTLKNKSYQYQGQTYPALPHGFARDMNFSLMSQTESEIWFSLEATEETRKIYPFDFRLELGYQLEGKNIKVLWKVINKGQSTMYFSIGAHPAFYCPLNSMENQSDYYISFDTEEAVRYQLIDEKSLMMKKPLSEQYILETEHGIIPVDPHMFDKDALIIENNQCQQVSLLDSSKTPYLSVTFDAPLFGLWSPAKKNAPFVCIEPWYGRCDASDFSGTLEEREWGNSLEPDSQFETFYTITIA